MKKILLLSFAILLFFNLYEPVSAKVYTNPIHLFVIAGQSNAIGRARIPLHQSTDPHVLKWDNGLWMLGIEPTHRGGGFGFAESFALRLFSLLKNPDYKIGLIPCGVAGTSIKLWQQGMSPYQSCLKQIAAIKAITPGATVDGVIFYQGETDTFTMATANAWPGLFKQFVRSFRIDIGNKNIPIIFAQIGPNPKISTRPAWERLQTVQFNLVGTDPNIKMIVTKDLTVAQPGDMHLDTKSEMMVGKRAANVYYSNFIVRSMKENIVLGWSGLP